jgi:signal transduction histidine kinase
VDRSRKERTGIRLPGQPILRNGWDDIRPATVALIGSSILVASLVLSFRFSVHAAPLRATVETAFILFGDVTAWLIWVRCTRTRQVSDFLLLAAVLKLTVAQFVFFAAPAMLGSRSPDCDATVPLLAHLEVAVLFAAAALVRRRLVPTRRQATILVGAPLVVGAAVSVGALLIYGDAAWFGPDAHPESTATTQAIALTLPSIFLMVVAAVGFLRSVFKQRNMMMGLLWGAAIFLAAAWSQSLPIPRLTADSVSGRECLCAGAFALILLYAFNSHRQLLRAQADELAAAERRRLVGDLHDGIAQDLAFIATYAERLAQDFGAEHPLTVAARRALAASRGIIADVSASEAPTTAAALRAVGHELSIRHGVRVLVKADGEDLPASKREAVVRIAREAIVNAVQHGQAQHISVSLENRDDELRLRISDDGRGLRDGVAAEPLRGFGLRAMRERAEAIGGDLMMDEPSDGGTAVEAVVS